MLDPLIADGQKVLVFSQFVQMLQLLEKECVARGIHTHMLTGQTKDRQTVVVQRPQDRDHAIAEAMATLAKPAAVVTLAATEARRSE